MVDLVNICDKLIKTYNTTIIDQMPPDLKDALQSNASYCSVNPYRQHEKERTVLNELIKNHFDEEKKAQREELTQNYIGGPMTLTGHWSEAYQKLIYLFGEKHADDTDCSKFLENYGYGRNEEKSGMRIETYLKKLTEINDIFLDIFVEIPAYKQKTLKYSTSDFLANASEGRLFKIGAEFSECMEEISELNPKKCSRSRIHYIDIRNVEWKKGYFNELDPLSNFINICYDTINLRTDLDLNQTKNELSNILFSDYGQYITEGLLSTKNTPEYLEFWYDTMLKNSYVKKELDNCDKQMAKKIYDFYKKEITEELDTVSILEGIDGSTKTVNNLERIQEITNNIVYYSHNDKMEPNMFIEHFNELRKFLIPINAATVDCYTFCRIFKKFNLQPENPQKRRFTDEPETPSNIIIYSGDNHSIRYRKFLKEIGFSLIVDIGSKLPVRNCINMTEHDTKQPGSESGWSLQPLFSAWPPPTQPSLLASLQQSTLFGGFSLPPAPEKGFGTQPVGGFFGAFGTPKKQSLKKEEAQRLKYERKLYDEDTLTGNVGKAPTKGDFKQKGRKSNHYK